MARILLVTYLFCFLVLAPSTALAFTEEAVGNPGGVKVHDVSAGLPTVTSEEFTGKLTRMIGAIYNDVIKVAPQITLLICIVGAVIGVFSQAARVSVIWSIGALLFILWIPQIIGLMRYYANL